MRVHPGSLQRATEPTYDPVSVVKVLAFIDAHASAIRALEPCHDPEFDHRIIGSKLPRPAQDPIHDLRHTMATVMLSEGTHPKVTLDIYSHVVPTVQRDAAE